MNTIELLKPVLQGGIDRVNFFNGRLLSAEDLKVQEAANQDHHRRIGKAIGPGVAWGLEVYKSGDSGIDAPKVLVVKGCAINGDGQILELPSDIEVDLRNTEKTAVQSPAEEEDFKPCSVITSEPIPYTGTDQGIYLLSLVPASRGKGKAPVSWLSDGAAPCATKYTVETIKFNLIRLDVDETRFDNQRTLRNYCAYACSNMDKYRALAMDPFTEDNPPKNLIDALRPTIVTDGMVPLAIVYWKEKEGIVFVDRWAVRRKPCPPAYDLWKQCAGDTREVELEAFFLQVEEHLEELRGIAPKNCVLCDEFDYLPSLVIYEAGPGADRFDESTFLSKLTTRHPIPLDRERIFQVIGESMRYLPYKIRQGDSVTVYRVQSTGNGAAGSLYCIAHPSMPFFGIRHDLSLPDVFREAWHAYSRLSQRNDFYPPETTADSIWARLAISNSIRDIGGYALAQAATLSAFDSVFEDAMDGFSTVYSMQKALAGYFKSNIPGIINNYELLRFAGTYESVLDFDLAAGTPALKGALTAASIPDCVNAQRRINDFVLTWTGLVISGTVRVQYESNENGNQLVRDQINVFIFSVRNDTNKRVTIKVGAQFDAPFNVEKWDKSITMTGNDGVPLSLVTVDQGASHLIKVTVTTPSDAVVGTTLRLRLRAAIPNQPIVDSDSYDVSVREQQVPPAPETVRFVNRVPEITGNTNDVKINEQIVYRVRLMYTNTTGAPSNDFVLSIFPAIGNKEAFYIDMYKPGEIDTYLEREVYPLEAEIRSKVFTMQKDVESLFEVKITSIDIHEALNTTMDFTITVKAVNDPTVNDSIGPFSITRKS